MISHSDGTSIQSVSISRSETASRALLSSASFPCSSVALLWVFRHVAATVRERNTVLLLEIQVFTQSREIKLNVVGSSALHVANNR
jgi:hypothetical protein